MDVIKDTTNKFISMKFTPEQQKSQAFNETVNLIYKNHMTSRYKQEEQRLKKIVDDHVKPNTATDVKLSIFYKNKTVANLFIRNNPHRPSPELRSHVVYRYSCEKEECHPSQTYVGHTTTTLKQRMTTHAQNGSIRKHNEEKHDRRLRTAEILQNVQVLFSSKDRQDLILAEALLIKKHQPTINSQREGEVRVLSIF